MRGTRQTTRNDSTTLNRWSWLWGAASGGEALGLPTDGKRLRRGGQAGQALVEFALTLPFLILLFVVLVELGLLIRSHLTVVSTVREGVRVVALRGNADPAVKINGTTDPSRPPGEILQGNETNRRVGQDADAALVQHVNSALQQESQNVKLLMTYRADATELDPGAAVDVISNTQVATTIGAFGLGGAYGVYYNPNSVSRKPFQEVFSYTLQQRNGVTVTNFVSQVLSTAQCAAAYTGVAPAQPDKPNLLGQSYASPFCGDDTPQGIDRAVALGKNSISPASNKNVTQIVGQLRYPGGPACTASNPDGTVPYAYALQCYRYNFAPWYPALRRSADVGLSADTNPNVSGYYNNQLDSAVTFAQAGSASRSPDYVGVQINYIHPWFLSFFPGSLPLTDKAVKLMDPVGGSFNPPDPWKS